ncbi:hypothetical protein OM416_01235 [Paenibacillus sp. LS1]|nr:hypothetical protein [Paenibacillus sp. LS1]
MDNYSGEYIDNLVPESFSLLKEKMVALLKCLEEDIPYKGFFHEMYSTETPFEYEER